MRKHIVVVGLGAALAMPIYAQTNEEPAAINHVPAVSAPAAPGPETPPAETAAPAPAPERPASPWPGRWLLDTFGASGLEALRSRGYVIVQGRPDAYRLQRVMWKQLESISRNTKYVPELSAALQQISAGKPLGPAGPLSFRSLGELPPDGLMTPALHALLAALSAYHEEWTALTGPAKDPSDIVPLLSESSLPGLFDTPWGKSFEARTRADMLQDAAPLVEPYFHSFLSGLEAVPGAVEHFIGRVQERHQTDVSAMLAADVKAGKLSEPLREHIRRYLVEERRLHAVDRIRRQVADLVKKTSLIRDMKSLDAVAEAFRRRPGLIAELEAVVQAAPPAGTAPELTATGLHLQKPLQLGQHELGDYVTVSGAYWIDGLPAGQSVEVDETMYREYPDGIRDVRVNTVKRANGGPYAFAQRLALEASVAFVVHAVISAPTGNVIDEDIAVPVAKEFELALLKTAEADALTQSCDLKGALQAYGKLEESLTDPAGEKPQYRALLDAVRKRKAAAAKDAAALERVTEAAAAALNDAAVERCNYDLKRLDDILALARSLPAGCDHNLFALRKHRQIIARRVADQQAFAARRAQAASRRKSCAFATAAEELGKGLAILDGDPAARCGPTAEAAGQAEAELASVQGEESWKTVFAAELAKAEAAQTPPEKLQVLNPLLARIGTMRAPACFAAERGRAEKLARAAGEDLVASEAVIAKLPADTEISAVVLQVSAQRRKLMAEEANLQNKKAAEQAPAASAPVAQPPALVPPKIEARPAAESKAKVKTKPAAAAGNPAGPAPKAAAKKTKTAAKKAPTDTNPAPEAKPSATEATR